MSRRQKHPEHENHERWLVSYADFITLLFAFFVVMFATAQSDKSKAKAVSDSVKEALEHGQLSAAIAGALHKGKPPAAPPAGSPQAASKSPSDKAAEADEQKKGEAPFRPKDLKESLAILQKSLNPELKSGKLQLTLEARGLVISLREAAFFASGDDAIASASVPILARISDVVRGMPNSIRLEGHTDSAPISNSRFKSNWELSAARSIAMLELLKGRLQIPASRMAVAGYAENAPVDDNATPEGRARNRRVDLVLLSAEAMASEPHGSQPLPAVQAPTPSKPAH